MFVIQSSESLGGFATFMSNHEIKIVFSRVDCISQDQQSYHIREATNLTLNT